MIKSKMHITEGTFVVGAVLTGGESRRMGHDKAFVLVDGVAMIDRVLGSVIPATDRVIIIGGDHEKYERVGRPTYPDSVVGLGPLSGLYTAFTVTKADFVFLAACDMPRIHPKSAINMVERGVGKADALIPLINDQEQGLFALYARSAITPFEERIKKGDIQFDEFRESIKKEHVTEEFFTPFDPELATFINVNTPEELDALKRR